VLGRRAERTHPTADLGEGDVGATLPVSG